MWRDPSRRDGQGLDVGKGSFIALLLYRSVPSQGFYTIWRHEISQWRHLISQGKEQFPVRISGSSHVWECIHSIFKDMDGVLYHKAKDNKNIFSTQDDPAISKYRGFWRVLAWLLSLYKCISHRSLQSSEQKMHHTNYIPVLFSLV